MKKLISFVMTILMLCSSFYYRPSHSTAAPADENGEGYFEILVKETETKADSAGKKLIDNFSGALYESDSNSFTVTKTELNGKSSQTVERTDEESDWSVTVKGEYEEAFNLSPYNELYFQFYAASEVTESISLTITLYSGIHSFSMTKLIPVGKLLNIYCPIGSFEQRDATDAVSFSLNCPEGTSKVTISTLYADSLYSYSYLTLFSSDRISSKFGIDFFENRLELVTEEGSSDVTARFSEVPEAAETVCTMVTISGALSGTVTLSVWDGLSNDYTDISTLTLYEGRNSYPFIFPAFKGTDSYRLTFSGINTAENEKLTLYGAVTTFFDESIEDSSEFPGSIASCTVLESGAKIRISGTLRSNSVVNNLGAKLNVYAVNQLWEDEDGAPVLLSSVDISTVFEISCDTQALKHNPHFYRYYISISHEDGETVASSAVYPSIAPSNFTMGNSVLGIQSDDSSAAFRTNASHTVVDIYLDKLLNTDGKGGRVHSYGGSFCYLSGSYITELDSRINFLNGSGVNVYLRILKGSNPDSRYIYSTPDCSSYGESLPYITMIDFLSSRYSEISGIILGSRIDCELYSYSGDDSVIDKAKNYVELLRITNIVARANAPEAEMIVPFGDGYVYGGDGDSGEYLYNSLSGFGENAVAPIMISEIISRFISSCGAFKWYCLYECESSPEAAMSTVYKMSARLTQGKGTSPSGHMVFWQPEKLITDSEIEALADSITENGTALGTGAVIISLNKQAADPAALFKLIEQHSFGENTSRKVTGNEALVIQDQSDTKKLELWDFTSSFSVSGFINGGAVTAISTEVSTTMAAFEGLDSCRALKGIIDTNSSSSGTVLCYFDTPKMLNNATSLELCINVTSSKTQVPVKITLGKGNVRYDYFANLTPESPSVIRCNTKLVDEKFAAEYIAVTFEPNTASAFEISKISAVNKNLTEDELLQRLNNTANETKLIALPSRSLITSLSFIGVTVIVFAILNARSSNDKKAKKKHIKK